MAWSTFESWQLWHIVVNACSASDRMNSFVSALFLSRILIIGSKYVSIHLFRKKNMSLIVIIATLERADLRESASLQICLTRE